ncbi:MAG: hypothetical protein KTR16_01735 [Acidiferrobacterales bacterium]|nr:hypothetical protein [Acidiferrobacterales bacterium]
MESALGTVNIPMQLSTTKRLFISVGSRFAMPRLLESVESTLETNPNLIIKAQVGESSFRSQRIQASKWMDAAEFEQALIECDAFISHAGMGNILLAAQYRKPIVIMPRKKEFGEHINDHQIDTATALIDRPNVYVAHNTFDIQQALNSISAQSIEPYCNDFEIDDRLNLISALKEFIDEG